MRDDFSKNVKETLAKRVGYRCSNPYCRVLTSGPQVDPAKSVNVGVASHITAASHGGPRFNENLMASQRNSVENGIWLCQKCAKLIDNDVRRYSVNTLNKWKEDAEKNALSEVQSGQKNTNSSKTIDSKKESEISGGLASPLKNSNETVEIISHEAFLSPNVGVLRIDGIIRNKLNETLDVVLSTDIYDSEKKIKVGRNLCNVNLDPHGLSKFRFLINGLDRGLKPRFEFKVESVTHKNNL